MLEILRADYRAHEALVHQARHRPELWRIAIGLVLIIGAFLFLARLLDNTVFSFLTPDQQDAFLESLDDGSSAGAVLFVLFQLGLLIPATLAICLAIHQRGFDSLIGPPIPALQQFLAVFATQLCLMFVFLLAPPYGIEAQGLTSNMSMGPWLLLLPLSLGALFVQCAGEEVLFRGYLQQQLAARFDLKFVWLLVPSALFALGHYAPGVMGENALLIAIWAGLFGFFMADLTARAGTLGPAVAVHLANNINALLLFAPNDDMYGLALYTMPFGLSDGDAVQAWLLLDLAYMFVSWLAARLVLRR